MVIVHPFRKANPPESPAKRFRIITRFSFPSTIALAALILCPPLLSATAKLPLLRCKPGHKASGTASHQWLCAFAQLNTAAQPSLWGPPRPPSLIFLPPQSCGTLSLLHPAPGPARCRFSRSAVTLWVKLQPSFLPPVSEHAWAPRRRSSFSSSTACQSPFSAYGA